MTPPILTPGDQYYIHLRIKAGENKQALADEFGVSRILIGRIGGRDPEVMKSEAGIVDEKPRIRIQAVTRPLTAGRESAEALFMLPKMPVHDVNPVAPAGRSIAPLALVRYKQKHVMAHGSIIVTDQEGKAVKVLRCPVYDKRWRMVHVQDVDVTGINGTEVRGEMRRLSGGTVSGTLLFDGIKSPDSGNQIVTRVEFHPE